MRATVSADQASDWDGAEQKTFMGNENVSSAGIRLERKMQSARFHDGRFRNTDLTESPIAKAKRSGWSTVGEYFFGDAIKRPPGVMPIESPLETWHSTPTPSTGLRVTWLGHSTTLVEIDGFRILTDPVWSERISPVPLVGPRRFHRAPVRIDQLPKLDAILISHDHYDHLDYPTVQTLARSRSPELEGVPIYTSLGVGERLENLGVPTHRITELDWWESALVKGRPSGGERSERTSELRIHATPCRHFSGRTPFDRNKTLWSSWVIETDHHRVYFSGDTGITNDFSVIREKKGPFDLVMLEVGAFHPSWGDIHLGPENALRAQEMLGGATLLPVHWGTFDLALHAWDEPIETLTARAAESNARVVTPRLGRVIEPSQIERIDPWWREVGKLAAAAADLNPTAQITSTATTTTQST